MSVDASEISSDERHVARRWMRLWRNGDLAEFSLLHSKNFVDNSPAGRKPDREGFRQGFVDLFKAFPDFKAEVEDLVLDEVASKVAIRWRAKGTHRGLFLGQEPSGKTVHFNGIEIIQIAEGQVVARWGEWNGLELIKQMKD